MFLGRHDRAALEANGKKAEIEGKLAAVQRKLDSMVKAIEDGLYQPSMKDRMAELEAEKARLIAGQNDAPALPAISVHPNMAELQLLVDAEVCNEAMDSSAR